MTLVGYAAADGAASSTSVGVAVSLFEVPKNSEILELELFDHSTHTFRPA